MVIGCAIVDVIKNHHNDSTPYKLGKVLQRMYSVFASFVRAECIRCQLPYEHFWETQIARNTNYLYGIIYRILTGSIRTTRLLGHLSCCLGVFFYSMVENYQFAAEFPIFATSDTISSEFKSEITIWKSHFPVLNITVQWESEFFLILLNHSNYVAESEKGFVILAEKWDLHSQNKFCMIWLIGDGITV